MTVRGLGGGGRPVTVLSPPRSMVAAHLTISPSRRLPDQGPLGLGPRSRGQQGQSGVLEATGLNGRVRGVTELCCKPGSLELQPVWCSAVEAFSLLVCILHMVCCAVIEFTLFFTALLCHLESHSILLTSHNDLKPYIFVMYIFTRKCMINTLSPHNM